MEKLADISAFESLGCDANNLFCAGRYASIFNIADPKEYYTGKPKNLDVWVSEPVTVEREDPNKTKYRYMIFKTTDGDYALQETWQDATDKISMTSYKNRVVETGSLESVVAKYKNYTKQDPKFKKGFGPAEQ